MNIIIDSLPESVIIDGREYPVNWGYRAFLLIEICLFDSRLNDEQKMLNCLNIFYNRNIPSNLSTAIEKLQWFYRCGGRERKKSGGSLRAPQKIIRCYDFEQDAPYIYSAFLTQYGIDLQETKNYDLHWWKFNALFESLGEDLKLSKIMYYRTAKTSGLDKERRRFLNEMKKLYALENPEDNTDAQMKLARRNARMKEYVRGRMLEVDNAEKG